MKTNKKVTTTLAYSFVVFAAMIGSIIYRSNKKANEVTVEVTADVKIEESNLAANEENLLLADIAMEDTNQVISKETKEVTQTIEPEVEVLNQTDVEEEIELDPLEMIDVAVHESVGDVIVTTFSMNDMNISFDKVLPRVNEFLNIRKDADSNSEVVGKLYKNSYAVIVDRGTEWTKVKSGGVEGYVSNEYLYFDDDAVTIAKSLDAFQIKVTAGSVNIRMKPTTESDIVGKASKGDTYTHVPEMDTQEWVAVQYNEDGTLAYISKDYIDEEFQLKTAVSKAEEEEAKKAAELAKALQEAKKYKPESTNRAAITVSDDELYLLAIVVAMEAGGESYEGQLAVANVVVNRMLDGYWGKTITDVVYAPGQFSGANSGRIEKFSTRVTESNKRAAVEALAGNNNIGDYMYFIMKNKANYSSYKKYYILGCHCFYSRS